jgi:hypothetical protein
VRAQITSLGSAVLRSTLLGSKPEDIV